MLWNRHGIGRVDRVHHERVYLDLGLLHIQSVAEIGSSIHRHGIVTIHEHNSTPLRRDVPLKRSYL